MSGNKHNLDLDIIIDLLKAGHTYRKIAEQLKVPVTTLYDFCNRDFDPNNPDASSPRQRTQRALQQSADMYAEMALEVLERAEGKSNGEIHRSNYLSSRLAWLASKRNPKMYGTQTEEDKPSKTVITINTSVSDEADTTKNDANPNSPPNEPESLDTSPF